MERHGNAMELHAPNDWSHVNSPKRCIGNWRRIGLLLWHAASCPHLDGSCSVQHCQKARDLWKACYSTKLKVVRKLKVAQTNKKKKKLILKRKITSITTPPPTVKTEDTPPLKKRRLIRAPWTQEEEVRLEAETLTGVSFSSILERFRSDFHESRTAKSLEAHYYQMRRKGQIEGVRPPSRPPLVLKRLTVPPPPKKEPEKPKVEATSKSDETNAGESSDDMALDDDVPLSALCAKMPPRARAPTPPSKPPRASPPALQIPPLQTALPAAPPPSAPDRSPLPSPIAFSGFPCPHCGCGVDCGLSFCQRCNKGFRPSCPSDFRGLPAPTPLTALPRSMSATPPPAVLEKDAAPKVTVVASVCGSAALRSGKIRLTVKKPPSLPPFCSLSVMEAMTRQQISDHVASVRTERVMRPLRRMLMKLMEHAGNRAGIFNHPVDFHALNIPDYPAVVKRPMDLGTVKQKMDAGQFESHKDFAVDVRLVFANAILYNPSGHPVHQIAQNLAAEFDAMMAKFLVKRRDEQTRLNSHSCPLCAGQECSVCKEKCVRLDPAPIMCECGERIQRNAHYYMRQDVAGDLRARKWCIKCFAKLGTEQRLKLLRLRNSDSFYEPWACCSVCDSWVHHSCGLFNPRADKRGDCAYVCPLCGIKGKTRLNACPGRNKKERAVGRPRKLRIRFGNSANPAPSQTPGIPSILGRTVGELVASLSPTMLPPPPSAVTEEVAGPPHRSNMIPTAKNLPLTALSVFIEVWLKLRIAEMLEDPVEARKTADSLSVRVVSLRRSSSSVKVPERLSSRKGLDWQGYPKEIPYTSVAVMLFQKLDQIDVAILCMYCQEYGETAPHPNKNRVYIGYIDSVNYLRPRRIRTALYQELLLSYLEFSRRGGARSVHIWQCPPPRGDNYIFHRHPPCQRTPGKDRLRQWYRSMLDRGEEIGLVQYVGHMYPYFFSLIHDHLEEYLPRWLEVHNPSSASPPPAAPHWSTVRQSVLDSTRYPPFALVPLPPLFDGDFWHMEVDRLGVREDEAKLKPPTRRKLPDGKTTPSGRARTPRKTTPRATSTGVGKARPRPRAVSVATGTAKGVSPRSTVLTPPPQTAKQGVVRGRSLSVNTPGVIRKPVVPVGNLLQLRGRNVPVNSIPMVSAVITRPFYSNCMSSASPKSRSNSMDCSRPGLRPYPRPNLSRQLSAPGPVLVHRLVAKPPKSPPPPLAVAPLRKKIVCFPPAFVPSVMGLGGMPSEVRLLIALMLPTRSVVALSRTSSAMNGDFGGRNGLFWKRRAVVDHSRDMRKWLAQAPFTGPCMAGLCRYPVPTAHPGLSGTAWRELCGAPPPTLDPSRLGGSVSVMTHLMRAVEALREDFLVVHLESQCCVCDAPAEANAAWRCRAGPGASEDMDVEVAKGDCRGCNMTVCGRCMALCPELALRHHQHKPLSSFSRGGGRKSCRAPAGFDEVIGLLKLPVPRFGQHLEDAPGCLLRGMATGEISNVVVDTRHAFLRQHQLGHCQYDSLRRAKQSTMALLQVLHQLVVPFDGLLQAAGAGNEPFGSL